MTDELKKLIDELHTLDEKRNGIIDDINGYLTELSNRYKGQKMKLDKHKGFNWAVFVGFRFYGFHHSKYEYTIVADLDKNGIKLCKNLNQIALADEAFINTPISKKIDYNEK